MKKTKKDIFKKLKSLCASFNSWDNNEKLMVINYLQDDSTELLTEHSEQFYELAQSVVNLIVEELNVEELNVNDQVIDHLIDFGLDKIVASTLYDFCKGVADPYIDARIVALLKEENLQNVCKFVLEKMILFKDYDTIPFDDFQTLAGLADKNAAHRVLRFIRSNYISVSSREMSPNYFESKLVKDFEIPQVIAEEIVKPVRENISDMHQAYLLDKVNDLLGKISEIATTSADE